MNEMSVQRLLKATPSQLRKNQTVILSASEAAAERSRRTPRLSAAPPAQLTFFPRGRVVLRFAVLCLCAAVSPLAGCHKSSDKAPSDHPRLTPKGALRDVIFRSTALNREMQYRVLAPADIAPGTKLPVVYLLHGGGGGFRDWSNYSDVARFAERGLILLMPEADESYYTNSAEQPQNRYEDYIVNDLISDAEKRLPVAPGRANRAVVGVSMGGFGAVKLALRHPELFCFAGGISSAIDVPSRPFSIKRIGQWRHHSSIFGAWGSATRRENDPFILVRCVDPLPHLWRTRRPAPRKPELRQTPPAARIRSRVPRRSRRSRVEPVEYAARWLLPQPVRASAFATLTPSFFHIPFRPNLCHN
jgi:pimeloyl-ACP methyl ester carboxylesterase